MGLRERRRPRDGEVKAVKMMRKRKFDDFDTSRLRYLAHYAHKIPQSLDQNEIKELGELAGRLVEIFIDWKAFSEESARG